jgi:hypothetical protein
MIKDVFELRKNSWHTKLMKFVWDYNYTDFKSMCPYFWLTVFNVVFIIPILFIKLLGLFLYLLIKGYESSSVAVEKICDNKTVRWAAEKTKFLWNDDKLILAIGDDANNYGKATKYTKIYHNLTEEERSKLLEKYYELKAERKRLLEEEGERLKRLQYEAQIKRNQRIAKMTIYTKNVFKIIIWPIMLFVLYLLFKLVVLFTTFDYSWIPTFFYYTFIFIFGITGIVLPIIGVKNIVDLISCSLKGVCIPCERRKQQLSRFFGYFSFVKYPFIWAGNFFVAIWKGLVMFKDTIVALKRDNCPAIDWKD